MRLTHAWLATALLAAFALCLAALAFSEPAVAPLPTFLFYAAAHLLLYIQLFHLWPRQTTRWRGTWCIVGLALVWRLLFLAYPVNDDIYRYIWEGSLVSSGINPYLNSPAALAASANGILFDWINHPDFAAIYPPLTLAIFGALATVAEWLSLSPGGTILLFKTALLLSDFLVVLLLVPVLRTWKRPPWWLALYAWNPLVLLYGVGEAHLDILHNLWLVLALLAFAAAHAGRGYLFLGAAIMTKYLSMIFVPFLVTRRNLRWLPLVLAPALLFLPMLDAGTFHNLLRFGSELHAHDLLPRLLRLLADDAAYRTLLPAIFAAGILTIWLIKQDAPIRALMLAWGWLLICLPTVHPWYLLPLVLLMTHSPSRPWMVLTMTVGFQFWIQHAHAATGVWQEQEWIWLAMYLPLLFACLLEWRRPALPWRTTYPPPSSVDIVIPVLNEAHNLPAFLASLDVARAHMPWPTHPILVDGGSTDETVSIARGHLLTIIQGCAKGRGNQLAAGIAHGNGDLIIMLHADALMAPDALHKLAVSLTRHPAAEWGIMGHIYDQRTWKLRLVELSNRLRFLLAGIAFGDQGIFVRREVLQRAGGMSEMRLMEDIELSLRLADAPRRLEIGKSISVSTRRWQQQRFAGYTLQVLGFVSTYLLLRRIGFSVDKLADKLYRRYYRRQ